MKKFLALTISMCLMLSIIPAVSADASFSDFSNEHWAYSYVMQLVSDGTVSGFEDGTFKPEETVTRAQFVKMIGKSNLIHSADFQDVSKSHWAYDYVMASGLDGTGSNLFKPEEGITRNDVARLVWKRGGEVRGLTVPYMITSQGTESDAVAFVYTYGIMNGDDGISLRLNSTLTRAEAAAIIVRAKAISSETLKKGFIDVIPQELLERTYDSFMLFSNDEYKPDRKMTNGEMATAALRIGLDEYNLTYQGVSVADPFEHKYSRALYVAGRYLLGEEVVNETFIDQNATIRDTIACFTYFTFKKSTSPLIYGEKDNFYQGISSARTDMENIMLTFAKTHGITLYADGIDPNAEITVKEAMAVLLQLDGMMGISTAHVISSDYKVKNVDLKMLKSLSEYPNNYKSFQVIQKDVPKAVYEAGFLNLKGTKNIEGNPKNDFSFAREYKSILIDMIKRYSARITSKTGVTLEFSYYPSMVFYNGNGYTLRMKVKVVSAPENQFLSSVISLYPEVDDLALYNGLEFYADFETGTQVIDLVVPVEHIKISQIISVR
jgi:hypothetical protein